MIEQTKEQKEKELGDLEKLYNTINKLTKLYGLPVYVTFKISGDFKLRILAATSDPAALDRLEELKERLEYIG